jgi:large subunit ribosomal protein L15
MRLSELQPSPGSKHPKKRVGRGLGTGQGKTAGRGEKGQKSRSGVSLKPGFEGGQMPLTRRLPKRGFTNIFRTPWTIINIRDLEIFPPDTVVDEGALRAAGLVKNRVARIKLLGQGEVKSPLVVRVQGVSAQAKARVEAAGGRVEVV